MSQLEPKRESLISELRDIERKDAEYYRQQGSGHGDVNAHTVRQQRRSQILLELAAHNLRRNPRLSLNIDVTLFCLGQGVIKGRICEISASGFAATLPIHLAYGESVTAEIHLPFGNKTVEAVVRNRIAFRHGFKILGTDLSEEMQWLQ